MKKKKQITATFEFNGQQYQFKKLPYKDSCQFLALVSPSIESLMQGGFQRAALKDILLSVSESLPELSLLVLNSAEPKCEWKIEQMLEQSPLQLMAVTGGYIVFSNMIGDFQRLLSTVSGLVPR